jgi:hypothetical protein
VGHANVQRGILRGPLAGTAAALPRQRRNAVDRNGGNDLFYNVLQGFQLIVMVKVGKLLWGTRTCRGVSCVVHSQGLPQHFLGSGGMQSIGITEMLCFTKFCKICS